MVGPPDWSDPTGAPHGDPAWSSADAPPPGPPTSGTSLLRARRVTEIIDTTLRLYRERWRTFLSLSAIIMIPISLLQVIFAEALAGTLVTPEGNPDLLGAMFVAIVVAIISLTGTTLLAGSVAWTTSELCLGRSREPGEAISFTLNKLGALIGAALLVGISVFGATLLFIIPGIIVAVSLMFTSIVLVVEGSAIRGSMGRSWALSKGNRWKILGLTLLTTLISVIVELVVAVVARLFGTGAFALFIRQAATTVIAAPITTIALTLLYYDIRIRKEGFDLSVMAQELGPAGS